MGFKKETRKNHIHQPRARVVRLECHDNPALGGQHGHVAAQGVARVQAGHVRGGELVLDLVSHGVVGRAADDDKVVSLLANTVSMYLLAGDIPRYIYIYIYTQEEEEGLREGG